MKTTCPRQGYLANKLLSDNEFSALDMPLSGEGMTFNKDALEEHVPEVENIPTDL